VTEERRTLLRSSESQLGIAGFLFLTTSLACLAVTLALVIPLKQSGIKPAEIKDTTRVLEIVSYYFSVLSGPIISLLAAAISAALGFSMLQSAGKATRIIIPDKDRHILEKMLAENNELGINLYARLSGLTGIVGAFTKVGLSGLPLATISLAILFSALALIPGEHSDGFFDLAKLTLGAFIGSYVQRQASETGRTGSQSTGKDGKTGADDKDEEENGKNGDNDADKQGNAGNKDGDPNIDHDPTVDTTSVGDKEKQKAP
jgi:hypothetical protein